jgi:hypothetical protein
MKKGCEIASWRAVVWREGVTSHPWVPLLSMYAAPPSFSDMVTEAYAFRAPLTAPREAWFLALLGGGGHCAMAAAATPPAACLLPAPSWRGGAGNERAWAYSPAAAASHHRLPPSVTCIPAAQATAADCMEACPIPSLSLYYLPALPQAYLGCLPS